MKTHIALFSISWVFASAAGAATPATSLHDVSYVSELENEVDATQTKVSPTAADCLNGYFKAIDAQLQSIELREPRRKAGITAVKIKVMEAQAKDEVSIDQGMLEFSTAANRLDGASCVSVTNVKNALIGGFVHWDLAKNMVQDDSFEDLELTEENKPEMVEDIPAEAPVTPAAAAMK